MDDIIYRQAALEAIEEYADRLQMVNWKENPTILYKAYALNWCINTIRDLPSAQPEQKTGHWIPILRASENDEYRCSVCSQPMGFDYDYCPHCGARMTSNPTYPSNSIN